MKKKIPIIIAICLVATLFSTEVVLAQPEVPYELTQGHWGSGRNSDGDIGHEPVFPMQPGQQVDSLVLIHENSVQIAAGANHSYFLLNNGEVWATGRNDNGQIGNGVDDGAPVLLPVQVEGLSNIKFINAGRRHGVAIDNENNLWAWGNNSHGQSAMDTTGHQYVPVQIAQDVIDADGGEHFTVYVTSDGNMYAFGRQGGGRLGNGEDDDVPIFDPQLVDTDVARVFAGWQHTWYLKNDGTLLGFGDNQWGKLGVGVHPLDDSAPFVNTPMVVDSDVVYASAKAHNGFYIKTDGSLWAAGSNFRGTFGDGETGNHSADNPDNFHPDPVMVFNDKEVLNVGTGARHVLFVTTDGEIYAAGHNNNNQLGFPGGTLGTYTHIANTLMDDKPPFISGGGDFVLVLADPLDLDIATYADYDANERPQSASLDQNYPNPFNPSTEIRFAIAEAGHVSLTIYNMLGEHVATLVNENKNTGAHTVTFDASGLSSGIYLYRLQVGSVVITRSMMFVK